MSQIDSLRGFMRDRGPVRSGAVAGHPLTRVDRILDGLTQAELRTANAGFNPAPWIMWHLARAEDGALSGIVFMVRSLLEEGDWGRRLGVPRGGDGFAMTAAEVAVMAAALDLGARREYRGAVGQRTRELAAGLWPEGWSSPVTEAERQAAGLADGDGPEVGTPRDFLLGWWGNPPQLLAHRACVAIRSRLVAAREA
jgi:hypothetical protein